MISAQGMMQTGMNSPGINQVGKCHLVNVPEPLIISMRNDLPYQRVVNGNKTINGVIDDLADRYHCCFFVKGFAGTAGKSTKAEFNKLFLPHPQPISTCGEGRSHLTTKNKVTYKRDYYFFSDHNYKPKTTNYKLIEWQ
jgi:hypothetical protein